MFEVIIASIRWNHLYLMCGVLAAIGVLQLVVLRPLEKRLAKERAQLDEHALLMRALVLAGRVVPAPLGGDETAGAAVRAAHLELSALSAMLGKWPRVLSAVAALLEVSDGLDLSRAFDQTDVNQIVVASKTAVAYKACLDAIYLELSRIRY